MENRYTYYGDITAENFEQVLCNISHVVNRKYKLIFEAGLIEKLCQEAQYPCYKFAHNLEGEFYMRAKVGRTTLEFLIRNNPTNLEKKESLILQIRNNGNFLYNKPENSKLAIYIG